MSTGELVLRAKREGEVLVVTATGTFTVNSARGLRDFIRGKLEWQDARAAVVDLRGVLMLVAEDGWLQIAEESTNAKMRVQVPVALLVLPAAFELARKHCRRLAPKDLLRLSFVERDAAVSWAARRMEHWGWLPAPIVSL